MTTEERRVIEQMYLEMFPLLMNYARSSLKQEGLAEEAVQETFRIACLKPKELCSSPNPKGWLINTLKFVIKNTIRSHNNASRLLAEFLAEQSRERAVSEDEIRLELLYENVAESEDFKLLSEMAVEGRSHLEMAEKRGITVNACKKRVQRAKEFLKKKIF